MWLYFSLTAACTNSFYFSSYNTTMPIDDLKGASGVKRQITEYNIKIAISYNDNDINQFINYFNIFIFQLHFNIFKVKTK